MAVMTGGQAIVRTLVNYGVDTIFGLPGIQLDNLYDAYYEHRNELRVIHTRHEQGAAYMAMGYAYSTGKVGVCTVVPGPGVLNATGALCTAYGMNAPVLCVTGQIPSGFIDKGLGMAHELIDQEGALRGIVSWSERANQPEEAPGLLRNAFRKMLAERPQPAVFAMPPDIMGKKADIELLEAESFEQGPEIDADLIARAAKLLNNARYPAIFVGGGVFGAEAEVTALAEQLQAPVIMSQNALGALPDTHPLALGLAPGYAIWNEVDVALVVGTRFTGPAMAWGRKGEVTIIRIDVDAAYAGRPDPADLTIIGRAKDALALLAGGVGKGSAAALGRVEQLHAVKAKVRMELDKIEPQAGFMNAVREEMPEDGIFVTDITQMANYFRYNGPFYRPRSCIGCGYQGTLGFSFATALGVQIANPGRKVMTIVGDGGFMFTVQELSTAVAFNIPVVTIVFNDKAFGNVKYVQKTRYGGRHISVDLHNPDIAALAKSFGALGFKAETPEELRKAIRAGFAANAPTLIEVPIGEVPNMSSLVPRPRGDGTTGAT